MDIQSSERDLLADAKAAQEASKRKAPSVAMPLLTVCGCVALLFGTAAAEVFSATMGFHAAFPPQADGTSLADAVMPLCYAIAAYVIFAHLLVRAGVHCFGKHIELVLVGLGLIAMFIMLVAMAMFQFSGTYGVTGSPDESSSVSSMAGPALGALTASLFTVSFVAAHFLTGALMKEVPVLLNAMRIQRDIAEHQKAIEEVEAAEARVTARRVIIDAMSRPDALRRRAAAEAAHELSLVKAKMSERLTEREMLDGEDLNEHDKAPLRDVSATLLRARFEALTPYNFDYFFNLLQQKEA